MKMSSEHNRLRRKWQDYGGASAAVAEAAFFDSFQKVFQDSEYRIRSKPKEFQRIYVDIPLSEKEKSEIHNPSLPITRHGVFPDYAIDNTKTKKTLYVEVKRQDGWVEGGKRADGRGNAHERSCKFFTPGLLKTLREASKIEAPHLPFWTVFQGDITRDPCRVREIKCWYEGVDAHFFFWRQSPNPELLFEHFEEKLAHLLD
jgi:hypothetical protein